MPQNIKGMARFSSVAGLRRWQRSPRVSGMTRLQEQARNNLGVIMTNDMTTTQMFRDDMLDVYDAYYENRAYIDLMPWEEAAKQTDRYVPIRERSPRVTYNVAKVLINKVASKLVGSSTFPQFVIEEDPDDTEYFRQVQKACQFRKALLQPTIHALLSGSVLIRYFIVNGTPKIEHYNTKYCYPQFDPAGELDSVEVRYVYEDPDDKRGSKPKLKWYRLVLTKMSDILFDNPEYQEGAGIPDFTVVNQNNHNLGWVQGEWQRTSTHKFTPDGYSLIGDVLDFIDDLNYSLSQSSQAVSYNQEPQLVFKGVDEDELEALIKSSQKGWNLGRDTSSAEFLETSLDGVTKAEEQRDHSRQLMLDVVRIVLHDPEKMVAAAQSGKALEVLNGPLVELVDELRTVFEPTWQRLLIKIGMTLLQVMADGFDTVMEVPPGYMPQSLDLTVKWPPIFPPTLADAQTAVMAANTAATGHLISHESLTRWLAPFFGIENIDEEVSKIQTEAETMPWLNPFGSFGGGGGFGGQ